MSCTVGLSIWSVGEVFRLRSELRDIYCDARDSVTAERKYTYPILRSLGYQPEEFAKGVQNPLTTPVGRFRVAADECRPLR